MDEEIRRYIDVLQELISRSGTSKREIERSVGWAKSSLTKLLKGQWEIKLRQLLEVLQVLRVEPLVFFRLVYKEIPLSDRLMKELSQGHAPDPILLPPAMSEEELDRRIEETVHKTIRASKKGSPTPRKE
ncbi:MAG: hypothetical protein ABIS20_01205 [Thermoanaerobaculia bacterium]